MTTAWGGQSASCEHGITMRQVRASQLRRLTCHWPAVVIFPCSQRTVHMDVLSRGPDWLFATMGEARHLYLSNYP